ncbi:MAG: hypothetical protein QOJ79_264 [Actinomycetota bacterium]|jgi:hypothetical protein|nr:hypothetical protein [Actinomycetota bacterium]
MHNSWYAAASGRVPLSPAAQECAFPSSQPAVACHAGSVDEAAKAAAWVERQLAQARAVVETHPLGPRDQSLEQHEQWVRGVAAACLRDIEQYVGLTVEQARVRAAATRDFLCSTTARPGTAPTGGRTASTSRWAPTGG